MKCDREVLQHDIRFYGKKKITNPKMLFFKYLMKHFYLFTKTYETLWSKKILLFRHRT